MINKSTLREVFNKFDREKHGSLDKMQFRKFLKAISKDLENDQIDAAFQLIDVDISNSIEFSELNNYYSKVNGIPNMEKKSSKQESTRMDE